LQRSFGFAVRELRRLEDLIEDNQQFLLDRWNEFFTG
jgi:hypothetical protein